MQLDTINWKRGLLRAWIVTTCCWVILIGIFSGVPRAVTTYWDFRNVPLEMRADAYAASRWPGTPVGETERQRALRELGGRLHLADEAVLKFLWIALLPPLVVMMLGVATVWVLRGFVI
jgi:hypothetical protein